MRAFVAPGLGVLLALAAAGPGLGQAPGRVLLPHGTVQQCVPTAGAHRAFVRGDRLNRAWALLLTESPTFAEAIAAIESTGLFRIRIGYRDHLMPRNERILGEDRGGAVFMADGNSHQPAGTILCGVRVVFFTERLESELIRAGVPEDELVRDLALVLAHEVFGHLVPFAEQPVTIWPTPCRDPVGRRARSTAGCAVERENVIRRELGADPRASYGHVAGPLLCALRDRPCALPDPRNHPLAGLAALRPEPVRVSTVLAPRRDTRRAAGVDDGLPAALPAP